MKTETWVRWAAIAVAVTAAGAALLAMRRLLSEIALPLGAAAIAASALRPAARRLGRRAGIPEKAGGAILLGAAAVLVSVGVTRAAQSAYGAAAGWVADALQALADGTGPLAGLSSLDGRLRQAIPAQHASLYETASGLIREALEAASGALTGAAAAGLSRLPRLLLSAAVFAVSLFYLYFDGDAALAPVLRLLGEERTARLRALYARIRSALGAWLRAEMLLSLLVFAELLSGFLILNLPHALRTALLVALVDLLPVLGAGAVLVPWGILSLFAGDVFRGVGLLVLCGVMAVVRQFAEPRLVGRTIGVHPLWTLLAMLSGFCLLGAAGGLFAPILLYTVRAAVGAPDKKSPGGT